MNLSNFLENEIIYPAGTPYAGIIGAAPSKGARSPALWNAVYDEIGSEVSMLPFDVSNDKLPPLLEKLESDSYFIGGAVTIPYKEKVADWLGVRRLNDAAKYIGAVNCLYRDEDGRICGTNTDGEAALKSIENNFSLDCEKKVIQIGAGGAGKAVAAYLKNTGYKVKVFVRDVKKIEGFCSSLDLEYYSLDMLPSHLATAALLINTTPIGFSGIGAADETPLNCDLLKLLPKKAGVFDIIYDPSPTKLLQFSMLEGLATLDGKEMNLEQAVLGFKYASPKVPIEKIREAMKLMKDELEKITA